MSRGQQGQVFGTGTKEANTLNPMANTSFTNAQTDLNTTQSDINSYGDALNAFKAANPYVTGGEFQTAQDQQLADTAAGQAEAAGQTLQSQAVRTGQNAGGAIAATEKMQQENERNLAGQEAAATEARLGAKTGYGEAVLGGTANKEGMQAGLAKEQGALGAEEGGLAADNLKIAEGAAQTPSFFDTLGSSFAGALGKTLGGAKFSAGGMSFGG